ncbi:Uncharacterised protein [Escherichia coli]|uniref:Uncharacterized protein n=1 Tax=Escherichia coli TaxID=562 RepID=A0A376U4D5_ECOLX|nr:Uncharacterised protein [Escherichia coli]
MNPGEKPTNRRLLHACNFGIWFWVYPESIKLLTISCGVSPDIFKSPLSSIAQIYTKTDYSAIRQFYIILY